MRTLTTEDIECRGIPKKIIGLVPREIITTDEGITDNYNLKDDIIKIVVIESHKGTMHIGIAYLKGMGLVLKFVIALYVFLMLSKQMLNLNHLK